eukprot:11407437-Heterocapsa_arctica.AAC.1
MGMHFQQPAVGMVKNPMVMVHQAMSDGSIQLVQWLEPPRATNLSLNHASQDQGQLTLPKTPLIGSEITGPPDGM